MGEGDAIAHRVRRPAREAPPRGIRPDRTPADGAARLGPTWAQGLTGAGVIGGFGALLILEPRDTFAALVVAVQVIFLISAAWRVILVIASRRRPPNPAPPSEWPRYTVLAALHDEAAVIDQLVENLSAIDYPEDRLEGWLVLEMDDEDTIAAALLADRPDWLGVLIAPPGAPRTKPRALNIALARATGELLTIYDAEDDPDPLQLRQAAARFAAEPDLGGLQAPLRIRRKHKTADASTFMDRQFAVEYASLFEVTLPGMARMGLPFPLGGTSNHLRVSALRDCGGWDAHNVTEDADLGFRLWCDGWRLGVIDRPTYETPPGHVGLWLPQRTRWLKGYMQTWGVHTRRPSRLGGRGLFALTMTIGLSIASALAHAPAMAMMLAAVLLAVVTGLPPLTPVFAVSVMILGAASAWLACAIGARRAHVDYQAGDMVCAPAYWALLSLAFGHAVWRLVRAPHAWDKTPHQPDTDPTEPEDAGRRAV